MKIKQPIQMFISALLLFTTLITHSQIMFQKNYGGDNLDQGTCVVQTDDGGYLVAGLTQSFGVYWQDIYLIKTDAYGDTLWTKRIGKSEYGEMPYSMIKTNDNNFVLTGYTEKYVSGDFVFEVLLLKFNEYGDTLWYKNYNIHSENSGYDVKQTNDNGFIITGYTRDNSTATSYALLIKTDENGVEEWKKTYSRGQNNGGNSILQTSDGCYFVAGYSTTNLPTIKDYCLLIKINPAGDTLWTKLYGGSVNDNCTCAYETINGDIFIVGNTTSFGNGLQDAFLSRLNFLGNEIWMKTFGGINDDYIKMFIPNDNGFALIGGTKSFGFGERDVYLIKTDLNGNELWYRTFGDFNDDMARYIQKTEDGGFIIAGSTNSFNADNYDVYLIKTDANGIAGFEKNIQTENQCFIYPNPCTDILNIQIHSFYDNDARFNLFNINGQLAKSEILQNNGTGIFSINVSNLPKGVYILNIQSKTKQFNNKVIIQ